jgi:hypothetical protein
MPMLCAVALCKNSWKTNQKQEQPKRVTFHRFPNKDVELRQKWITFMQFNENKKQYF